MIASDDSSGRYKSLPILHKGSSMSAVHAGAASHECTRHNSLGLQVNEEEACCEAAAGEKHPKPKIMSLLQWDPWEPVRDAYCERRLT